MSEKILWIYLLVVAAGGPAVLWLLKARITAVEERRKKHITRIKGGYDAIQTTSPHDRPVKVAREAALEGIETRFTIIRRVVKYTLLLIWILALDKEGAHCWIAAWADTPADAWQLAHDTRTKLATELRKRGIKTHTHELHWPGCSPG